MRKQVTKNSNSLRYVVPYISEVERSALNILKDDPDNKKELKELLEEFAARYARESISRN